MRIWERKGKGMPAWIWAGEGTHSRPATQALLERQGEEQWKPKDMKWVDKGVGHTSDWPLCSSSSRASRSWFGTSALPSGPTHSTRCSSCCLSPAR